MDLTPQTLREVEFREKLRGYHPDDVDEFLEQAALALEGLLARLQATEAMAGGAEPLVVAEGRPVAPDRVSEDTLKRTLLLAQRTADAAVAEAEESARRMVEAAREEAGRLVSEAEAKVAASAKEARARAEAAVSDLEQRRAGLERELQSLQTWAGQQRDRLRDVLTDQVRALDIWLATSGPPKPIVARPSEAAKVSSGARPFPGAAPAKDAPPSAGLGGADDRPTGERQGAAVASVESSSASERR